MNGVDLVLVAVLALYLLRGYWRGFFRECFGLLALVVGIVAAVQGAQAAGEVMQEYVRLPAAVQAGAAFVVIFVVAHGVVNVIGVLLDRTATTRFQRALNGFGGAMLGTGKGAAVLALVLLFLHLFPLAPTLDEHIMASAIGRPLMTAAADMFRLVGQSETQPNPPSQT